MSKSCAFLRSKRTKRTNTCMRELESCQKGKNNNPLRQFFSEERQEMSIAAPLPYSINAKVVRLHFRCRGIPDMDTFSKSDPYVVLYSRNTNTGSKGALPFLANQYQPRVRSAKTPGKATALSNRPSTVGGVSRYGKEIGRTEVIMNDLNPVFKQTIDMQFLFESRQDLVAVVFDSDGELDDDKNDLCGIADFQLSQVICSANGKKEFPLGKPDGTKQGFIEVSFTDMNMNTRDTLRLGLAASGLPSGGFCTGSSPYYVLSRFNPNGSKEAVYKSEVVKNTSNPMWRPSDALPLSRLTGLNESQETMLIEVFTKSFFGSDSCIGSVKTSLSNLQEARQSQLAIALKKDGDRSSSGKRRGAVEVNRCDVARFPTFASSLAAGWQINLVVSIDFTGSNGDPRDSTSLHYMNRSSPNQYVSAMMSVGDILLEYDSDKMIPVYGFGANLPTIGVSHFFHVNRKDDPNVFGIQGALDAYGAFLPTVTLSGPTNFAPTVRYVTAAAREAEASRVYTILLIITDGEITDMRDTLDALVEADDAPLSIVIVGVGSQCDFQAMDELDGDDTNLKASNGRVSRRDLVQFVPFRDFSPPKPREALAAEVLREVPDQFEEYLVLREQRCDPSSAGQRAV